VGAKSGSLGLPALFRAILPPANNPTFNMYHILSVTQGKMASSRTKIKWFKFTVFSRTLQQIFKFVTVLSQSCGPASLVHTSSHANQLAPNSIVSHKI